jgi:ferrous iron transport protein B
MLKGDTPSFLVELPPYRVPRPGVVVHRMLEQGKQFVVRAGTLILASSVIVWALSYWPRHPDAGAEARADVERARAAATEVAEEREIERQRQEQAVAAAKAYQAEMGKVAERKYAEFLADEARKAEEREASIAALEADAENAAAGEALRHSALGRMGHAVEPVFEPIGWDWKVGMAVIASFPAREVVVSTLGVIYNLGDADEESVDLQDRLKEATFDAGPKKGRPVFDVASAIALMVFFSLCAQCASTLVVIWRETGTWRWAAFAFGYMTLLAYLGAIATAWALRAALPAEALRWWA